jgi:hypothetical protein
MLNKEQLLTPAQAEPIKVEILGDFVFIKSVTFSQLVPAFKMNDELSRNAYTIANCVCDETGKTLLTIPEARKFLETQPANISLPLLAAINQSMPITAEKIESAEKNSEIAPS